MMASAVILAILTVITFTMPDLSPTGKILFAYGAYMAWGLVYQYPVFFPGQCHDP